eukprot:scaffold20900_cov64-Phaeocystis_antarctica.AAC.7
MDMVISLASPEAEQRGQNDLITSSRKAVGRQRTVRGSGRPHRPLTLDLVSQMCHGRRVRGSGFMQHL